MQELDRRQFLIINALGLLSLRCNKEDAQNISQGDIKESKASYTVESLQKLGEELREWRLTDGTLMVDKFPEIKKSADLLSGALDPTQYFPFIRIPVGLSIIPGTERAALLMQRIPDPNDPRRIVITSRDGQVLNTPILAKNTPVDLSLSQDVLNSSVRLPIVVKEVSQLLAYPDYSRAFINYLKATYGITVSLHNPNNVPTSENEVFISIANNTGLENALTGKQVFRTFVDNGSFLRTGTAFANWYQDQLNQGLKPQGKLVETGLRTTNFLIEHGLIRREVDLFVWMNNVPPQINDNKFLELVNDFSLAR